MSFPGIPTMINASAGASAFQKPQTLTKRNFEYTIREAAFFTIVHSSAPHVDQLLELRTGEWRELLHWLDVSGLALYLGHQLAVLNCWSSVPKAVTDRLQQNLKDNDARIRELLDECASIHAAFEREHLVYALSKGFTLYPSSVPNLALRHQLDLDFLVDERCAPAARNALERAGYRLYAISGRSWEFKKNEAPRFSTQTMYKAGYGYTVELHVEPFEASDNSVLSRVERRKIEGITMPTLSPADLFLRQSLHVFKDLCSPFMRGAHLLELYRHICSRRNDAIFWRQLRSLAERDPSSIARLAVSLALMQARMAINLPEELAGWTTRDIPAPVLRWIDLHGRRSFYETPPGTKLYLILRREMELTGLTFARPIAEAILPRRLPRAIIAASRHEPAAFRMQRYLMQLQFLFIRLRFHVVEGIRYGWESYRWKRRSVEPA
jgi:hypothetical protein